jgi:hypothetical protein
LAQLQACRLLQDSSFAMWGEEEEEIEWKRDEMLCHWETVRYFVNKHVQQLALTLNRQDQVDVQRIMQGIDQLVGLTNHNDNDKKSPREILQDYIDNNNNNKSQEENQDCTAAQPSMQFCSWVASQLSRQNYNNDAKRLLEVIERVPQWRVRRSVENMPKDLLQEACCVGRRRGSGVDFARGRALLASFLINANMLVHQPMMAPVPSLSSASNVSSLVHDYLLLHNNNNHNKGMMPNVYGLVLALWDFHLNKRDILETIQKFASWFPVKPIVVQYQTILTSMDSNSSCCTVQQVLRATDMVCTLIGTEADEWNEIWNETLCYGTLLPLMHAAVLDPDEALGKCALLGVILERLFYQHIMAASVVVITSCPQLGWIAFLMSDLPTQDDVTRTSIDPSLGQLYARVSTALTTTTTTQVRASTVDDSVILLPPLSIYIDSVLGAALLLRRHSGPATHVVWERHVVRTLSFYNKKSSDNNVAVEWIQCLNKRWKNEETTATNPLVMSLHQRVCLYLWGPNAQIVPSTTLPALPQLLMSQHCAAGILLWTPPECLFAHHHHQEDNLVVSLRQMCSIYGSSCHYCLSHIVVGIAILQPNISADAACCRHELYQHLRNVVVNGDSTFVKRVERELLPYPTISLEWWKELYADLVRNEVPVSFVVKGDLSELNADFVDNILSKRRKRQREENDGQQEAQQVESLMTRPPKARSRESATTVVLGKLWGSIKHASIAETPLTKDSAIREEEFPCLENDNGASSRMDDDDDYYDDDDDDEEDDRILLL